MKFPYIVITALLIAGCKKQAQIEFSGNIPGLKSGVFTVKNLADSTVFGENIKDGKFAIAPKRLNHPGFYKMSLSEESNSEDRGEFEVYLEGGKYTIEARAGELYRYPKIASPSKNQTELSSFYTMVDSLSAGAQQQITTISKKLTVDYFKLSREAYNDLVAKQAENEAKLRDADAVVFKQFIKQYPQSEIAGHIFSKLDYEGDPVTYYALFKTLSPAAQQSEDGQEIGDKLSHMIKLVAGKKAPALEGNMPDGKPFNAKIIQKKLIVLDFWKAGNSISRTNHDQIKTLLAQPDVEKNVAFISISLDSKPDWWKTALRDDQLSWTQVSDLKGNDSPNAANYNITEIPSYYLLDGNWTILVPKIGLKSIGFEVGQYLKKHP